MTYESTLKEGISRAPSTVKTHACHTTYVRILLVSQITLITTEL
jgi:hypothetical protein